jgi:hypothetical protein
MCPLEEVYAQQQQQHEAACAFPLTLRTAHSLEASHCLAHVPPPASARTTVGSFSPQV